MMLWRLENMPRSSSDMTSDDILHLKRSQLDPPRSTWGGGIRKVELDNGVQAWALSSSQYVQSAVKNVEDYVSTQQGDRWRMPLKAETPMRTSYRPELDISPELQPTEATYYQSLIGILRWIVELGRVDICLEVLMVSSHLALPREGHLSQVLQIFSHLQKYHNSEMVFDPSDPVINGRVSCERIGPRASLGTSMARRNSHRTCPSPVGRALPCVQRWTQIMLLTP